MTDPIRFSWIELFDRPKTVKPLEQPDFPAFMVWLKSQAKEGPKKEGCPLLMPVADWEHLHKNNENVQVMSRIFVADIDKISDEKFNGVLGLLEGLSYGVCTTHSHKSERSKGLGCYRVFLELDREYLPEDHPGVWGAINAGLGGVLDPETDKISNGYFYPRWDAARANDFLCEYEPGAPLSVDELLKDAPPASTKANAPAIATPTKTVTRSQVLNEVSAWARGAKDAERQEIAKHAKALLQGKNTVPIGSGQRNGFLISLAGYLALRYPDVIPESLADAFATVGWDLLNPDGKYPIETFAGMISRMQDAEATKRAERKAVADEERRAHIRLVTKGERDNTITDEEVENLKRIFGPQWTQHIFACWKLDLFCLRPDGTYDPGPIMECRVPQALRDRLAVFGDHIETTYMNDEGQERQKTNAQIVAEYGSITRKVIADMTLPRGRWDPDKEIVYLPAATPIVDPVYHESVAGWLSTLDSHLTDALSVMPKHGELLQALILTGEASTGKTVLASAVGQIYGSACLQGDVALGKFNEKLAEQPIVFMDEKASASYKQEGTSLIRRFLTERTRWLDEKYQAKIQLEGFARLIIAANNLEILNTNEPMGPNDRDAFAERLLHICMDPGKAYLDTMRDRIQSEWIDQRHLAEHILWLSKNHVIKVRGARFAVEHVPTDLQAGLATQAGAAADVSSWVLHFIANPILATKMGLPAVYDAEKHTVRINPGAVVRGWPVYMKEQLAPKQSELTRAIQCISKKGRQKIVVNGKRHDAYDLDIEALRTANARSSIIDKDTFDEIFPRQT